MGEGKKRVERYAKGFQLLRANTRAIANNPVGNKLERKASDTWAEGCDKC